ncbi:MAG: SpoIIE family protein phosphatase [Gemmatimonadetes bacterium]|nr:SpoIIE family protein phosphatase [Gemmatimonadota bacterium]
MTRILVVDDEPDLELLLRQKFRRKVRKGEVDLLFASNGVEALEVLKANSDVDIVLSDINMPEMDGLTLLQQINQLSLDLRAVIVTAYGDMRNIRTAMNRGAFDFVTKPIDFDDLDVTIQRTMNNLQVMRDALQSRDELVALRQELGVAAKMQEAILPTTFPVDPAFELFAWMTPAKEVGGDFYDFFEVEDGRQAVVVADVSGKGVPAALFMMVSRTLVKGTGLGDPDPGTCLREVNDLLCESNEESMFVTMFFANLDKGSGRFRFANGGHNLPYVIRANGEIEAVVGETGLILGIVEGAEYQTGHIDLKPGDTVFMFTDGVTEAMNARDELLGEAELEDILAEAAGKGAAEIVRYVIKELYEHVGHAPQSDDITCLALKYLGH